MPTVFQVKTVLPVKQVDQANAVHQADEVLSETTVHEAHQVHKVSTVEVSEVKMAALAQQVHQVQEANEGAAADEVPPVNEALAYQETMEPEATTVSQAKQVHQVQKDTEVKSVFTVSAESQDIEVLLANQVSTVKPVFQVLTDKVVHAVAKVLKVHEVCLVQTA